MPASQKITERFSRNPEKPADEDVAERVFLIPEERTQLRYHCRDDHITASRREFLRRTEVDSKGNKIIMTPDMCINFEVGPEGVAGGGRGSGRGGGSPQLGNALGGSLMVPSPEVHLRSWENQELPSGDPRFCSSSENLPLSHQERPPSRPRLLVIVPFPQSGTEPTPDPGDPHWSRRGSYHLCGAGFPRLNPHSPGAFLSPSGPQFVFFYYLCFIDEETEAQRG